MKISPSALPSDAAGKLSRSDVVRQLYGWIEDGTFIAGQPLPSERELAQRLKVGRAVVRGALQLLEAQNRIVSGGGNSRLVAAPDVAVGALCDTVALISSRLLRLSAAALQDGFKLDVQLLRALEGADWHALLLHTSRLNSTGVSGLTGARPAGVIIGEVDDELERVAQLADSFRAANTPVVAYGDWPQLADHDRVTADHQGGSYALTRWLIENGRTRILQLWPSLPTGYWFAERNKGYARAMHQAGLEALPPALMAREEYPLPDGELDEAAHHAIWDAKVRHTVGQIVEYLVGAGRVDALLVHTDAEAYAVMAACRLCGLEPNRDVWVAGYDNHWREWRARLPLAWEPGVPIATVEKDPAQSARELVELLRARRAGELPDAPQRVVVPSQLQITPIAQVAAASPSTTPGPQRRRDDFAAKSAAKTLG